MTTTRIPTILPLTIAEYQALAAGIPKNCPTATFGVAGKTYSATEAVAFINTVLSAVSASASAKTSWKDARIAEETLVLQDGPTVRGMREILATLFSNNTTALAELMIPVRKPYKPLTTAARAAANAKAAATREARGTKGSAQKAAITGDVTGVTITPVTSGAASVSTTAAPSTTSSAPASGSAVAPPGLGGAAVGSAAPVTPAASAAPVASAPPAASAAPAGSTSEAPAPSPAPAGTVAPAVVAAH